MALTKAEIFRLISRKEEMKKEIATIDATIKAWMDAGAFTDEQRNQMRQDYYQWTGRK